MNFDLHILLVPAGLLLAAAMIVWQGNLQAKLAWQTSKAEAAADALVRLDRHHKALLAEAVRLTAKLQSYKTIAKLSGIPSELTLVGLHDIQRDLQTIRLDLKVSATLAYRPEYFSEVCRHPEEIAQAIARLQHTNILHLAEKISTQYSSGPLEVDPVWWERLSAEANALRGPGWADAVDFPAQRGRRMPGR